MVTSPLSRFASERSERREKARHDGRAADRWVRQLIGRQDKSNSARANRAKLKALAVLERPAPATCQSQGSLGSRHNLPTAGILGQYQLIASHPAVVSLAAERIGQLHIPNGQSLKHDQNPTA